MNEIDGKLFPLRVLRTNAAASAAFLRSEAFCHVPVFVTTGDHLEIEQQIERERVLHESAVSFPIDGNDLEIEQQIERERVLHESAVSFPIDGNVRPYIPLGACQRQ
jgi:hypothetical protein